MGPSWLNPENRPLGPKPKFKGLPPHSAGLEPAVSLDDVIVRVSPEDPEEPFDHLISRTREKLEERRRVVIQDEGNVHDC